MNQEVLMMFNGDESVRLNTDAGNEVTADGVIAALYNEMQQSMQEETETRQIVVVDGAQNIVTPSFEPFKDVDDSALLTDIPRPPAGAASNGVNENLIMMDDGVTVPLSDDTSLKNKNIEIPDAWKLELMESNGLVPHNAEPLIEPEKQTCQLWECPKCAALFRDKDTCELHVIKSHDFTCGLCSEPFQEKEELENHIIKHISEVPGHVLQMVKKPDEKAAAVDTGLNVAETKNVFTSVSAMTTSAVTTVDSSNSNCVSHESVEASINSSSTEEKNSDIFVCNICNLSFSSKQHLEEHEETHMDEDSYNSPEVQPSTPTVSLEESESSSKGHSQFTCHICDKVCFTRNSLLLHLNKKHRGLVNKNYTCEECGQGFKWKVSLENHLVIQHNRKKRSFHCTICEEVCSSSEALSKHLQSHEQRDNPFACDSCGAKFRQSANLLSHIKANHPNGEKFSCPECGKSFKIKKFLEAHVLEVHGQKDSNRCKYCLKSFMSCDSLMYHIQTHHTSKEEEEEEKQYNCAICGCCFMSSRDLYQHMTVHAAEVRNFECNICGKLFKLEDSLNLHLNTHTDFMMHHSASET